MAFGNPSLDRPPLTPKALRRCGACALATAALSACDAEAPTFSLWDEAATPVVASADDPNAVELGVRFRAAVDGRIAGLRFYKGPQNAGPHIGDLWSATGEQSRVGDLRRRDAGWLAAGRSGRAGGDHGGRHSVAVASCAERLLRRHADQRAPDRAEGRGGGNSVFVYVPSGAFPRETFNASNHWVDVVCEVAAPVPAVRIAADRPVASGRQ